MKKMLIVLLALMFLLSGCDFLDGLLNPDRNPNSNGDSSGGDKTPQQPIVISIEKSDDVLLNAFVDVTPNNYSYIETPQVIGPEKLAETVSKKMDEDFYAFIKETWNEILRVQEAKDSGAEMSKVTVFRTRTVVLGEEEISTVLGETNWALGYSGGRRDTKVFHIKKTNGDFVDWPTQLEYYDKTVDEAMSALKLFQKDNSGATISEEDRKLLLQADVATQENLAATLGGDKIIIINDLDEDKADGLLEIFIMKEDDSLFYVTEMTYAILGFMASDDFVRKHWVQIPVEYNGGRLQAAEDPDSPIMIRYRY